MTHREKQEVEQVATAVDLREWYEWRAAVFEHIDREIHEEIRQRYEEYIGIRTLSNKVIRDRDERS